MSTPPKIKLIIAGPKTSGKTRLSNLLADITIQSSNYDPTVGCRIVEFERRIITKVNGRDASININIELWDISGNVNYESCWPAIEKSSLGVVYVFNTSNFASSKELTYDQDIDYWYSGLFSKSNNDYDMSQCLIYLLTDNELPGSASINAKNKILNKVAPKTKIVSTHFDDKNNILKEFDIFIAKVYGFLENEKQ